MNKQEWRLRYHCSVKLPLLTRPGKSNCAITMLMGLLTLLCLTTDMYVKKNKDAS